MVTMTSAFPTTLNFGAGSWVQVQGTQESSVNNSGYIYQVTSYNSATFTFKAAVCSTGEPSCPAIINYSNSSDTGAVRFNNFFSWSLYGTNFGFSVPGSSTISGIVVTANVTTTCPPGGCSTGVANGHSAPYVDIGLIGDNPSKTVCSTCAIGVPKFNNCAR
jgi:hypothetical protein